MINFYKYHRDVLNKYDEYGTALSLCSYYWFCYGEMEDHTSILHIIKRVPKYAYYYARFIIEDRWLDAEPFIIKDRGAAHDYARYVLKGRWPEAEPYIKCDEYWWDPYCKHFKIPT